MIKEGFQVSFSKVRAGLTMAVFIGLSGYALTNILHSSIFDPLLIALILGIIIKSSLHNIKKYDSGIALASSIFIPIGIIFYGLNNLNFTKLTEFEPSGLLLLTAVMFVYFLVILFLGRLLKQREEITYLTASGSAICGASAIAVTSPAVKAEPDDVSIALLSVAIAAFAGFALILPFVAILFNLNCKDYSFLAGSTLQFTGLVKIAEQYTPFLRKDMPASEMLSLALSVKAGRYLGLLVGIPLFSSLIKKRLSCPWFLWAFLISGLVGTWIYTTRGTSFHSALVLYINPVHTVSWSIAMSAIGLRVNVKELLSDNGAKALIMAFAGFFAAIITFLLGINIAYR
jgi:uncharacterized integral membrane protein (TIGR00698 family)